MECPEGNQHYYSGRLSQPSYWTKSEERVLILGDMKRHTVQLIE